MLQCNPDQAVPMEVGSAWIFFAAQSGSVMCKSEQTVLRTDASLTRHGESLVIYHLSHAGLSVSIDIKPRDDRNVINTTSSGSIPVAILSTPQFNAPLDVNIDSVRFGWKEGEHPTGHGARTARGIHAGESIFERSVLRSLPTLLPLYRASSSTRF